MDDKTQYISKNIQNIRSSDRKSSQKVTFIKLPINDELEGINENRQRIRDSFKGKLQIILQKPNKLDQVEDDYKFNDEQQQQMKLKLSRQLNLELSYFQSDRIFLSLQEFHNQYEMQNILGEGCIGLVKKIQDKLTKEYFAVKMVATTDEEIIRNTIIEFTNLIKLCHENIVKVHYLYINFNDSFQSESSVYVVMDFIEGQEMFESITNNGHYNETKAKELFQQLLSAIEYMHKHGVCHRDLKPHNILCTKDLNVIKVTDFNVSKFSEGYKDFTDIMNNKIEMWTYTGTVAFSAPEIFMGGGYTQMVDIWSAGCILYSMLSGQLPFNAIYLNDLIQKIQTAEIEFPQEYFSIISDDAKNLIQNLLQKDPMCRLQPSEALKHNWFQIEQPFRGRKNKKTLSAIIDNISHLTPRNSNSNRHRTILLRNKDSNVWSKRGLSVEQSSPDCEETEIYSSQPLALQNKNQIKFQSQDQKSPQELSFDQAVFSDSYSYYSEEFDQAEQGEQNQKQQEQEKQYQQQKHYQQQQIRQNKTIVKSKFGCQYEQELVKKQQNSSDNDMYKEGN